VYIHRLKLRAPELATLQVHRPTLEARLHEGARVTSIVAGPGFGKTTLAARFASTWGGPALWYSADASDADLAVFVAHLDAGLRSWGGDARPLDVDNAASLGSPREIGTRLSDYLTDVGPAALLIFDDVHLLEGSRSLEALAEFVDRGHRAGARFILCGRSMPLSLHRIAAAGALDTIVAGDLAMRDPEVREFLERAGNGAASERAVETLAARAEGWPAGLALIVQTATARRRLAAEGDLGSSDQSKKYLFEYLAREVLDALSEADHRFLLETSILDRLETPACDAIVGAGRSAPTLASLVERGLFVSRRSPDAFSVHTLFSEFLQQELQRTYAAADIARLHRSASAFYKSRGDPVAAIEHLIQAGQRDEAADLLGHVAFSSLRAGMIGAVSALMNGIGSERAEARPALLAVRGRLERERGDWDVALLTLERAVNAARAARDYDVLAESVRFIAPILGSRNDLERLEAMLTEALSLGANLPGSSVTSLRMTLAAVQLEGDRLEEALAMYRELTPSLVARGDIASQGLVLHNVAVAQLRKGELYAGLSTYERALKFKEDAGQLASVLHTLGDIIYVKTLIGDLDEADRLVERLLGQATDLGMAATVARAHEQRGLLALLRGNIDEAREAYLTAQAACDPSDVRVLPDIEHGLALCALHRGDLKEAEFLVARAADAFRRANRHQQLAPLLITQARCAEARGDKAATAGWALEAISAASQGVDAMLECVTCLDGAELLADCASKSGGTDASAWEKTASTAAARAVALIHERDYRFLLRTKADLFGKLRPRLKRWGIGAALFPEDRGVETVASMRIEMLGGFHVSVNGHPVSADAWKRRKAPELFALLVSGRGRQVPRTRIVDLFWPESDADAAHDSLRVTVTAIRKAVGDVIKYEANAYRFSPPADVTVDADLFDGHIAHAREADSRGDAREALRSYELAVDLYKGEYLEEFADGGWQWRERERLRADALEALRWLARVRRQEGDVAGQRQALERILEVSPFDLEAVRMRLDALVREQRAEEAARDYASWRTRYLQMIGAEAPAIWDSTRQQGIERTDMEPVVRGL
jgi:ATP/maltotriose-dependent transcriptional regulator MalT/DNA-binding SARP family transcriptional activator